MKAIWDSEARKVQRQVAAYIRKEFGVKRAKKFRQKVDDTVNRLMCNPGIGQIDPLFEDRAWTYRSVIVNGLNKIVYFGEDLIDRLVMISATYRTDFRHRTYRKTA